MRNRWKNFVAWVDASVTLPEDSESIRIQKTTITIAYLVFIPITFLWTLALFNLQLWAAGWINLADERFHLPDFLVARPYASRVYPAQNKKLFLLRGKISANSKDLHFKIVSSNAK